MKKTILNIGGALVLLVAIAIPSQASTITFTVSGTNTGEPISASAEFTTSAGAVSVTLTNTLATPVNSVASSITGIAFVLSNGATAFLSTDTGRLVSIATDGSFTDVAGSGADDLDWANITSTPPPNGATWNAGGSPSQAILPGQADYAAAGGSIAGNGPHNPFVYGSAILTFSSAGTTAETTVTSAVIYFGTTFTPFTASPGSPPPPPPPPPPPGSVPEPSSLTLLGCGLIGLAGLARRRRMK